MVTLNGARTLSEILSWAQDTEGIRLTALDSSEDVDGYTELHQPQIIVREPYYVSVPTGITPGTLICREMVEYMMQSLGLLEINGA